MRAWIVAACLVVSASARAGTPAYTFAVTARGSGLDLAFGNPTKQPVTLTTHVRAGIDHFDDLAVTVTAADGTKRTLTFAEARTKAIPVDETIAPGATLVEHVDLQLWAVRGGNGSAPLAPGDYAVAATWSGLAASTKLAIAAPVDKRCTDKWNTTPRRATAPPQLELLAHQVGTTPVIEVGVHNFDTDSHCVMAYVKTYETQSDWLTVKIGKLGIAFDDDRDKSVPIEVELPPGATVWSRWDLAAWAARPRNGKHALPSGTQLATLTYDATRESEGMAIQLTTAIAVTIP